MKELTLAIRNKSNNSFLEALEKKYAPKKQKVEEVGGKQDKKRKRNHS